MVVDEDNGTLLGEVTGHQRRARHGDRGANGPRVRDVGQRRVGRDVRSEDPQDAREDPRGRGRRRDHLRRRVGPRVHVQRRRAFLDGHRSAAGTLITNIPLGGKPEYGASAGDGKVYVNLTDTSEVVEIDAKARRSCGDGRRRRASSRWRWRSTPRTIDCSADAAAACWRSRTTRRARSSRRRRSALASTAPASTPRQATSSPSNADGTLTVIHQDSADHYSVVQTLTTAPGSRNMGLDPTNHRIFVAAAKFGPAPANGRGRGPLVAGSFSLLVIERSPGK